VPPRFEELDFRSTPRGDVSLRRRSDPVLGTDVYEVLLGDEYLMSSAFTVAEEELARLVLAQLPGSGLEVVVGGLGLGCTAAAALADARTLLAVVDGRRVVALDLSTGTTNTRSGGSFGVGLFDGPPAVGPGGMAITATTAGLLLGFDAGGDEQLRIAVDRPPPAPAGDGGPGIPSFFGAVEAKASPPVVVDREGRVGFVRAGGRAGVVAPDGSVALAAERVCSAPVAVLPAGERRMLVACRDGTLVMLEE